MAATLANYQYLLAWALYLACASLVLWVWWRLTRRLGRDTRAFIRGLPLILACTPWYATAARDYFAPAMLVMVMDLAVGDPENGRRAGLALIIAFIILLLFILLRRQRRKRRAGGEGDWSGGAGWR